MNQRSSADRDRDRDDVRRVPRSDIAWPPGQSSESAAPTALEPRAVPPTPASVAVRAVYVLALLTVFSPVTLSSLLALTRGGSGLTLALAFLLVPTAIVMALALARAAQVLRNGRRIAAPRDEGTTRWIRRLGVLLMGVGVVAVLGQYFAAPIGLTLLGGGPSDRGVTTFIVGVWFAMAGSLAPIGLLLFECARLLEFERNLLEQSR